MSPRPSSVSAPLASRMVRESILVATRKRHARREIRLDEPGDDVHRGPLRGQHQVNADGARHLRQARDGFLHVGAVHHHQVGEFVHDDDDVGQRLLLLPSSNSEGVLPCVEDAGCTGRCCARPSAPAASGGAPSHALRCAAHCWPACGSLMMGVYRCGMPS